jgi:hypothetical protein
VRNEIGRALGSRAIGGKIRYPEKVQAGRDRNAPRQTDSITNTQGGKTMATEKATAADEYAGRLFMTYWLAPNNKASIVRRENKQSRVVMSHYGDVTNRRWCELERDRIGATKCEIIERKDGKIALVRGQA